jgi:TolB protein
MRPTLPLLVAALVLGAMLATAQPRPPVRSHITVIDRDGSNKRVVFSSDELFEAPNWTPDGKSLILNSRGKLWKAPATGGEPEQIPTGDVTGINNDHGVSPDGKQLVISAGHMYVLPFEGGEPRQITEHRPSYYHGWSPDGRTLAYCAPRDNNFDIYTIPVEGGPERRLTSHPGYDDGPDYSPDGRWIYFNSDRTGSWELWRMPADGAGPNDERAQQITSDRQENWFPHPSPDGKWIVFISFPEGTKGHPPNHQVTLRIMAAPGAKPSATPQIREVVSLFGGQGTINVNSWSPDSRRFAYVSYELR